jgi:BASS family bile acid:Na+ symporter
LGLLTFLSRQARWALPAGVFLGVLFPWLAELLRPLLTAAVIGTLTGALLRLDWRRFGDLGRRPALPAALSLWQLLLSPLLVWIGSAALGLPPDLRMVLLLQAAAPPIGSAAVFALILGLDGVLAALSTVVSTLMLPLTLTPLVALLLPATGVQVDLLPFFLRVTLLVVVPFALAGLLRRLIGPERLHRADAILGGSNVLLLVVFAIAVMDGVTMRLLDEPVQVAVLLATACVAGLLLHLSAYLLFRRSGTTVAYTSAILGGNRNVGLMLVITAGTAGEVFSLYVGIAQIPMYFAPLLLTPLLRRGRAQAGSSSA